MSYFYAKQIDVPFHEAVIRTKAALQKEGFGTLTEIDVKATLKVKLNVDFDDYVIIGACNPPFAYKALWAERNIGLLLPCNLIVYQDKGSTVVASILPTRTMNMVENEELRGIAMQVETKLKKVIDSMQ